MRIIYIVEPEDMLPSKEGAGEKYVPNFTIPGESQQKKQTISDLAEIAAGPLAAAVLLGTRSSLPVSLLSAAAYASPAIIKLFKDEKTPPNEDKALNKNIVSFMTKHAITIDIAKNRGYIFPPGHPKINQTYQIHPLSDLKESGKEKLYIPKEAYDQILMEEKESELIRLLVALGATKISITKNSGEKNQASNSASIAASANTSISGSAATSAQSNKTNNYHNMDTRVFELTGKPWKPGDSVDKKLYGWIQHEPSWGALVVAREIGGCTKATIEIRENTSLASDKIIEAQIRSNFFDAKANGTSSNSIENERSYWIEADFSPFVS